MTTKSELCIKCQACCKVLTFEVPLYTGTLEFYKARGLHTVYKDKHTATVIVPHICPQLTEGGCKIYLLRPAGCKMYDGSKSFVMRDQCLWNKEEHND